jgi:hypothetical protein
VLRSRIFSGPSKQRLLGVALASVAAYLFALCAIFEPRWESNDDIAMSMVAHGYGLAAFGSPHLIFSNVVWGYLVRALPDLFGFLGYSIATLLVLLAVGVTLLYVLLRFGVWYPAALLLICLMLARPTLWAQFTINSGLLALAAIASLRFHIRFANGGSLIAFWLLAFASYLIRSQEFLLVFAVGSALLPWHGMRKRRSVQVAFIGLGVAIVCAALFDRASYAGPEWQYFREMNAARAPFTDFGAGSRLLQRTDVMSRYGFSANDVALIDGFFFVDPAIANPKILTSMLHEIGLEPANLLNVRSGVDALETLLSRALLPLLIPAFILLLTMPTRRVMVTWGLAFAGVFSMGLMGRPSIVRVYVPLCCLLLVAPLLVRPLVESHRKRVTALLLAACVGSGFEMASLLADTVTHIRRIKADVPNLPPGTFVSWGVGLPMEVIYTLFSKRAESSMLRIFPLGVFTHAPFSVAVADSNGGRGFIERMRSPEGLSIMASPDNLSRLGIWCTEHLHGSYRNTEIYASSSLSLNKVWCTAR